VYASIYTSAYFFSSLSSSLAPLPSPVNHVDLSEQVTHPPTPPTGGNTGGKSPPTSLSPPPSTPPKNDETIGSVGYELPHGFVPGVEAEVKIDIPNPMNMFD